MIQNGSTATSQFSVALSYDPRRRLTSALVHNLSKMETSGVIQDVMRHREDIALPTLPPSPLLVSRMKSTSTELLDGNRQILEIEHQIGI